MFSWRPGQHCFLRLPSYSVSTTILSPSLPFPSQQAVGKARHPPSDIQTTSFSVRSHAGFTRKPSCYTSDKIDGPMHSWIDGPHDGVGRSIENKYDRVILVAGGSGITSCLPWLQYISQHMKDGTNRTANVKLL